MLGELIDMVGFKGSFGAIRVCHAETPWRTLNCRSCSSVLQHSASYWKARESFDADKPKNIVLGSYL